MTDPADTDEPTAPMRPTALHSAPVTDNWSRDEARHYASIVTDPELADPDRSGMVKLAWAFIRLDQQYSRLEKRVDALLLSGEELDALNGLMWDMKSDETFGSNYPQAFTALVRLLTAQRED